MYADLHLHSTESDGQLTPTELVEKAKVLGFKAIALTDHDTISGLSEAQVAGAGVNLEVIAGIELSAIDTRERGEVEVHVLGYYINYQDMTLQKVLKQIKHSRQNRAINMVKKLNDLNILISIENVEALAGSGTIGRPHIARAMEEAGYIKEIKEAFTKKYIGRGGLAYVERFKISPQEAIQLISDAGGLAVLAHPGFLSDQTALGEKEIKDYIDFGLAGLEVYYSKHKQDQLKYYEDIVKKYDLLITGGSDCHGGADSLIGSVKLPYGYVEILKKAVDY